MRYALILLLTASCFAQIQGNRTHLYQCALDRAVVNSPGSIAWPENVQVNDTIVLGFVTDPGSTFSLADNLAASGSWTSTSVTLTPAPHASSNVWMAYKKFTAGGAVTITLTRTSGTGFLYMAGCQLTGVNGVDGAVATATAGSPASPFIGSISTSNTTLTNNDLCISTLGSGSVTGGNTFMLGNTQAPLLEDTASPAISLFMSALRAGTAGSITATNSLWGGSSTYAMQTLCFVPDSIRIADSALPDVGSGVTYSAQLHCIGGTAAQTYSSTGAALPTGLSLNTTTGVISGSTTATGTYALQFKCSDGTLTSSGQNLTMTVGSTLGVPNIRQSKPISADNGGGSVTVNVQCGSNIHVFARGDDTHGANGWTQAATGANNKITDTFSSTWRRFDGPITGNGGWPLVDYVTTATKSGADTITLQNNQSGSSGRLTSLVVEITGGSNWDQGSQAVAFVNTATGSVAPSFTTVVPNTLLIAVADTNLPASWSIAAPFSPFSTDGDVQGSTQYSSTVVSSPSTVTATSSFTGGSTDHQAYDSLIVPIRPALAVTGCPANFGTGEKIRRQIF